MNNKKSDHGPGLDEVLAGAKRWALLEGLAKGSSQEEQSATKLSQSLEEKGGRTTPLAEAIPESNPRTNTVLGAVKDQVGNPPVAPEPVAPPRSTPAASQTAQSFGHLFRQAPTSPSEDVSKSNQTPLKALLKHIAS